MAPDKTPKRPDNLPLAISAVVFTVFALSLGDAIIKFFSASLPLWQIFVVRSLVAAVALVAFWALFLRGATGLKPVATGWTVLRSLMLTFMWVAYYAALPHIELSVAAAVYYTLPLFITLLAGLILSEPVGARGWFAVLLGFCGIVLILRPDASGFNIHAVLPMLAALLYAGAMILTRSKCRNEHPLVLSLALNTSMLVVGIVASLALAIWPPTAQDIEANRFLLTAWTSMGLREWVIAVGLATIIIIGSVGAAIAYQNGPASTVATFDFAYLAFAVLWNIIFFAEWPDLLTTTGIAMIATAGIIAVRK